MKIAVWHNLPSGGGKRALHQHVSALLTRGHEVEAWCPATADTGYLPLRDLVPEHVLPLVPPAPTGTRVGRVLRSYPDALRLRSRMHRMSAEFARQTAGRGFDLLLAGSCSFYAMPTVTRGAVVPTVVYLQEPFRSLYEARPALPWVWMGRDSRVDESPILRLGRSAGMSVMLPALRLQAREEWANAHAATAVLVNSCYSRETVLRVYGRDAEVCYLGVDTRLFRPHLREREHVVVGMGSLNWVKGVDLAVRSIAALPEPRPPLVWIANSVDESYLQQVREQASESGVELRVRVRLSDPEVVETLNRAALFLYTSRLEPFGLAPLEANACGTPVVAVAEGGVRETIRDGVNGLLTGAAPEQIAAAVGRLLTDPPLARELGRRGAEEVAREWSAERSADRLEEQLLRVAHGAAGANQREPRSCDV